MCPYQNFPKMSRPLGGKNGPRFWRPPTLIRKSYLQELRHGGRGATFVNLGVLVSGNTFLNVLPQAVVMHIWLRLPIHSAVVLDILLRLPIPSAVVLVLGIRPRLLSCLLGSGCRSCRRWS